MFRKYRSTDDEILWLQIFLNVLFHLSRHMNRSELGHTDFLVNSINCDYEGIHAVII